MKNPMEKHDRFILDTVLPLLINHSREVNSSTEEAAMAVFLALGTIMQNKGVSDHDLITAIKASKLSPHAEPARLQ